MNVCPIINHTARAKCLNFLAEQKCTTMYYTTVVTLHILEVNLETRVEFQDVVFTKHEFTKHSLVNSLHLIENQSYTFIRQILTT